MKSGRISPSHEGWTGPELILVEYYEYQGDLMSADNPFIAGCAVYPLTADALVRGAMVIIYGLVGKPELNHRHGLVVGPLTDSGRVPVAIAPVQPTELLISVAVRPENLAIPPEAPESIARAWNNLAFAYKRANRYNEAGEAYELALSLNPGEPSTLANFSKLCLTMIREKCGDVDALRRKANHLITELFKPVTTLPELAGFESVCGIDFVPGYEERRLHCGIVAQDQPGATSYVRQWVFDEEALVEINPLTGAGIDLDCRSRLPMSSEAREALRSGVE